MKIVLDASATVGIALNRAASDRFRTVMEEAEETIAPDLLIAEVVNAIWKSHEFEKLDLKICDRAIEEFPRLINRIIPSQDLYREAFALSRATHKPAYDMFYLALAQREDAVLLTMDQSLKKEAARRGIRVAT